MIDICPDCENFPPRIITVNLPDGFAFECRDCGYYWEELSNAQDFFQNKYENLGGFDIDDVSSRLTHEVNGGDTDEGE